MRASWTGLLLAMLGILAGCGGRGGSSSAPPTRPTRFAYAANSNDNTVSIYTVDAATGRLRANGWALAGTQPRSVTVHPSGKFAYVANGYSNDVWAYTIDASTGALTSVGSTVAAAMNPISVSIAGSIR